MVQPSKSRGVACVSSPHTRGDGPFMKLGILPWDEFSPHAWGWSEMHRVRVLLAAVLPTRVGMVRVRATTLRSHRRSPHTRGDGPRGILLVLSAWAFSPHAWGWSERRRTSGVDTIVLPTRVGMVRRLRHQRHRLRRSPHTRGDGPRTMRWWRRWRWFSPHAWGWSVRIR